MTNTNSPVGAKVVGYLDSAAYEIKVNKYIVPASDGTALFVGDFVKTTGTSDANGFPICTKANAGDTLRGAVISFEAERPDENITYRAANDRRVVLVADGPYIEAEMQVNGVLDATDVGKYANIVNNGGETATGLSKTQVDLSSVSTTSRQLIIVSIIDRVKNDLGAFSKVKVVIHDHELQHGVTGSEENLWKKISGSPDYLIPFSSGNELGATADRMPTGWFDDIKSTAGNIADVSFSGAFIDFDTAPAATVKFSTVNGVQFGAGQNVNEIVTSISAGSTDTEVPTAKAVYDHSPTVEAIEVENITTQLGAGGVTVFTLSNAPINPTNTGAFYNGARQEYGVNFTVSGATLTWINGAPSFTLGSDDGTNNFVIEYDKVSSAPGTLDQDKIIYVAKAGNDANSGQSIEKPVLTVAQAETLVLAQSPSSSNRWCIFVVDAGIYSPPSTVPTYTHLYAPYSTFSGGAQMSSNSAWTFDVMNLPISGIGFSCDGSGNYHISGKQVNNTAANPLGFFVDNGANVYANIDLIDVNVSGGKGYTVANSSTLKIKTHNNIVEQAASTIDGTSAVYVQTDSASYKDNVKVADIETGHFRENTLSAFRAGQSIDLADVTGDGTAYDIPFDTDSTSGFFDLQSDYNTGNGRYSASYDQIFQASASVLIGLGIITAHDVTCDIVHRNSGGSILSTCPLYQLAPNNIKTSILDQSVGFSGGCTFNLSATDTLAVRVTGFNSGKSIDVLANSQFSGHVVTAL